MYQVFEIKQQGKSFCGLLKTHVQKIILFHARMFMTHMEQCIRQYHPTHILNMVHTYVRTYTHTQRFQETFEIFTYCSFHVDINWARHTGKVVLMLL